jgi:hypothetical protein
MTRKLKALGLALIATAALGALAASAAQAQPTFNAETELEWHPTGEPIEIALIKGTLSSGGETTCSQGHGDPTQTYKGSQTKLRGTPTVSECHVNIFGANLPTTVTHNGCETEFHITKKLETGTYEGTSQLVCPEGVKGIEIHVFTDGAHTQVRCTNTIKPQVVSGILTHNEPTGDVKVTSNTALVNVTKTAGSLLQCGGANQTAQTHGDGTLTATNSNAEPVKVSIVGE